MHIVHQHIVKELSKGLEELLGYLPSPEDILESFHITLQIPEGNWAPIDEASYDPMDWDSAPKDLNSANPAIVSGNWLFIYGSDDQYAFFFKFARVE